MNESSYLNAEGLKSERKNFRRDEEKSEISNTDRLQPPMYFLLYHMRNENRTVSGEMEDIDGWSGLDSQDLTSNCTSYRYTLLQSPSF